MLLVAALAQPASAQQFSWANQDTRGTGAAHGTSIATDAAGNSFVVGRFDKTLHIGDSTFVAHEYYNDIYFAKYDSTGQLAWVRRIGCPTQDAAQVVGVDGEGGAYIAGSFSGVISFGDTTMLAGHSFSSEQNAYLARY
ncbi:MAG: hypothetical protein ICV83_30415, partial [Cytophagales bacterium]|nr:hypothetical protein [Cytophagales bacterium]